MILSPDYSRIRMDIFLRSHRRKAFDHHDWEERVQFADQSLDLDSLLPGVFLGKVPFRNAIIIDFTRRFPDGRAEHPTVTIPFGVGQVYLKGADARKVAMDLVRKNENAYSRVAVFNVTKFGGKGIFSDETDRLYDPKRTVGQ